MLLKSSTGITIVIVASIAIGIATVAAFAPSLSSPSLANDLDVTIVGPKSTYEIGEPVRFAVRADGMTVRAVCNEDVPSARILQDSTGDEVWTSKPALELAQSCDEPLRVYSAWEFGNEKATHRVENGVIVINEPGSYTVLASYDGVSAEAKMTIINSSNAAAAISASAQYNDSAIPQPTELAPRPPPMELTNYGPEAESFTEAKSLTGLEVKLPSYVPKGFALESSRTLVQTERPSTMITAFYTQGKQTTDSDNFGSVVEDGALAILYIRDAQYSDQKYDWEKVVQQSVDEAPEVRTRVSVDSYTAMLVKGDASKEIFSKAKVFVNGTFIEAVSLNLDADELQKILHSIVAS